MNYLIKNAKHNIDLISVSYSNGTIMFRTFHRYTGTIENHMTIINSNDFYSDLTEYPINNSIFVFDGTTYILRWYRQLSCEENQLQIGGTYAVVQDTDTNRVIRLDSDKFPDTEISDWKYIRSRSLRMISKFHLFKELTSIDSCNWEFCLNGLEDSTAIAFNGNLEATLYKDSQVSIIPQFNYSISEERVLTISTNNDVSGKIKIIGSYGDLTMIELQIVNGQVQMQLPESEVDLTILYGFNKVLTING